MNPVVLDASLAIAWCLPDEASAPAEALLAALRQSQIFVPAIWVLEVANGLLAAERSRRITPAAIEEALATIATLVLHTEPAPALQDAGAILAVARANQLTAYDAAYLDLALRKGVTLATLDRRLRQAAERAGVALLKP